MSDEDELLRESEKTVVALGRMFPGLCEVVLHDLRDPEHAVRAVEGGLSGRRVGDLATELGLARIQDPGYPDVLQNHPDRVPGGRAAKSTSIGIRNGEGRFVAAICLNLDVSPRAPWGPPPGRNWSVPSRRGASSRSSTPYRPSPSSSGSHAPRSTTTCADGRTGDWGRRETREGGISGRRVRGTRRGPG